ncbi:MAG: hypothetical protein HKP58_08680 [Desulfatitalea sp.]|nr:hypothetical protein [Desulfatitalea sp.]NNK00473.1 hypothetical protein [Desulfatitalea sp.]
MFIKAKVHAAPSAKARLSAALGHLLGRLLMCSAILVLMMSLSAQAAKPTLGDDLLGASFPEAMKGWVSGRYGVMYHSADGGMTWAAQATGTRATLASVFFVDSESGWAVGDASTILHTTDGGKTWTRQKSPVSNFYLMDVFFVSPAKGWIVTERTHILFTENGGESWTIQFSDQDFILKSVSFSDALNGWAVGEYGYIYHTADGGAHWQWQAGEFGEDMETGEIKGGNYLFGVAAVDAKRAWAVGIDGHATRTLDGGMTWEVVPTGSGKVALTSVSTDRSGTVVAIAQKEGILLSTDEGKSWTKPAFEPPLGYKWLYRMVRRGDSGFAAVGMEGTIYQGDGRSASSPWRQIGN